VSGWQTAKISEIEPRNNAWVPIRDHFGGTAYGINAFVAAKEGDNVIGEHSEDLAQHEELYVVLEGHATFSVAGDHIDAPAGTIVFIRDPSARRGAIAKEAGTTVLAVGAEPGAVFKVSSWEVAWPWMSRGMALYREQKYAEAAGVFEEGLGEVEDGSGLHFNIACVKALNGEKEAAFEHLRKAIAGYPNFAEAARNDSDFDSVRDDPHFPA
jgi:quercetin dioxygenase-like cupin family protein